MQHSVNLKHHVPRRRLLALAVASAVFVACGEGDDDEDLAPPSSPTPSRPVGWADATHGSDAEPGFAAVFPGDRVNRITFVIAPATWEAMLANMVDLFGERDSGSGGSGGLQPQGGRGGLNVPNPEWFPVRVEFDGNAWEHVGLRFKGNSSLRGAWYAGSDRLPFKLDFDEFEDDFPEIDNQRFHGFKQLSLANNFRDATGMRETMAYDLFNKAGLVAANTAFYEVILDRGEGPQSLGLYTMVEVIDDTVIARSFDDDGGTIFEGDGIAASLVLGTPSQIEDSFQVEAGDEDWGPIIQLREVLHSEERFADPSAWREHLESLFDVDTFLEWLAVSSALLHWDTYGRMPHNFFLYDDPSTGRLTWISWDHNLVLEAAPDAGSTTVPPAGRDQRSTSFDRANIGDDWPLIRYLLDDPVYAGRYHDYLEITAERVFVLPDIESEYERMAAILRPAIPEIERSTFEDALAALIATTRAQAAALDQFLKD